MARTQGATGKARYVGITLAQLRRQFTDEATIYVSIEHHGAAFGVNRDSAPRVKTITLADGPAPVASVAPVAVPGVVPVVDIPEENEEKMPPAVPQDLGDY